MSEYDLPEGKTCFDCDYYADTCIWLVGTSRESTKCDWIPIKFSENDEKKGKHNLEEPTTNT